MLSFSDLVVILVEPSPSQARMICARMAQLNITRVHLVSSGAQALELARVDAGTNLMVSAMYLPDMTGVELLAELRKLPETRHLAFVLVSSETRPQALEPVRQLGASAIIPKPFSSQNLEHALRVTLDYLSEDYSLDTDDRDLEMLRVLLVDDSVAARNYMSKVLENLGIVNVYQASNGREAVRLIDDTTFDLMITDYNMPEMDGRELVEHVRKHSWQQSIPILMVSSETSESRLAAVEEAGVSGICDKPFEPALVRSLLEKILHQDE